jgi:DNA repair protein RadC
MRSILYIANAFAQNGFRQASSEEILAAACAVLAARVPRGSPFDSPGVVRDYLRVQLATREHEVFIVAGPEVVSMTECGRL